MEGKIIIIEPSTGGVVPIKSIIGRDKEIGDFWRILKKQGIALFAERRFGKSSILRKMEQEVKTGFVFVYLPVEGAKSIEELVALLTDRCVEKKIISENFSKKLEKLYNKASEVIPEVGSVKFGKFTYKWQKQLINLFLKLEEKYINDTIVIVLDEFSIFLDELDASEAKSILGFLRDIVHKEEFMNLRFIYNGSIGIDLVLDKLKKEGHNIGDPLNHMKRYELKPFTDKNAWYFGECLKKGCKIAITQELIKQVCLRANNIPYFIDVVFDMISSKIEENQIVNKQIVDKSFKEIIDDTTSNNSIKHFYDRI